MLPLLSAAQMRDADRYTLDSLSVPDIILMEHAALGIVAALEDRFGSLLVETRGLILAGPGNNGGDALAVARILAQKGVSRLFVTLFDEGAHLTPAAALQLKMAGKFAVPWGRDFDPGMLSACDWIVDGLFGTGLKKPPEGRVKEAIEALNGFHGRKWIVAADIPSGLSADTGNPLGEAVRASETVTFGFWKKGLVTGKAADYVGKVRLAPLQIPRSVPLEAESLLYTDEDARRLPERRPAGHKGDYGQVFLWAGVPEKQGAASLSALAALRTGAGLVTLIGDKADLAEVRPRLPPEIMTEDFSPDLFERKRDQVGVFGPGMGTEADRWRVLEWALRSDWRLVLDADALTLISRQEEAGRRLVAQRSNFATVMTPHPKEAARLLQWEVSEVERDRYATVRELSERFQCTCLLKGKGTLIGGINRPTIVVTAGDSGLSKGGTGDTLSGIIASLLAQHLSADRAAPLGSYLHGRASERLTQRFGQERSTLASEISHEIPYVLKEIEWSKWNRP